jgi:hypothetical protein
MQKIQKGRGFNGLAGGSRPAKNVQKMQKFAGEGACTACTREATG